MILHHHRAYHDCPCREENRDASSPGHFFNKKKQELLDEYEKLHPRTEALLVHGDGRLKCGPRSNAHARLRP